MQTLKMDFQSQSTPPVVPVMQSDAQSRFIGLTLYDGGVPYSAPSGAQYTVQYRGSGANNMGWYDTIQLSSGTRKAVTVSSSSPNVVTLELAEQALRVNGKVEVSLCVVNNTGYKLNTFPIICRVTGAPYVDPVSVRSYFYVTGLTSEQWLAYVTACQDAQKRAEDAAATFETDPTLSVSGKAADAAKVGEAVNAEAERAKGVESQIKEDLEDSILRGIYPIYKLNAINAEAVDAELNLTANTMHLFCAEYVGTSYTVSFKNAKNETVSTLVNNVSESTKAIFFVPEDTASIHIWNNSANGSGTKITIYALDTYFSNFEKKVVLSDYLKQYENVTDYIADIKKGETVTVEMKMQYSKGSAPTSVTLYNTDIFSVSEATNLKLWESVDASQYAMTFVADKNYKFVHVWKDAGIVSLTVTKKKAKNQSKALDITFTNGGYYPNYDYADTTNRVKTQVFAGIGLFIVSFPDTMQAHYYMPNANGDFDHIVATRPFSVFSDGKFGVFFSNKDTSTPISTSSDLKDIKIWHIESRTESEYDVSLSASDSRENDKLKSDIVCDGINDTDILAGLIGCSDSINVLLYGGSYHITKMWEHSATSKVSLGFSEYSYGELGTGHRRYITVHGDKKCTPQTYGAVNLIVSKDLHESLKNSEMNYFIIGAPCSTDEEIQRIAVSADFANFNIVGYGYDKPITYVDTTRCLSTMLESVNVRSWHKDIVLYNPFETTPNPECCGIRVGRGSNYGIQNYVKHLNVWYCGKGIACNGEHFIFEDIKVHHDYIGFVFGDRKTVGRMEHPNILLGCSIEGCYRLMVLTKNGITEQSDFVEDYSNRLQNSTLIIIGLSTETSWSIPTDERTKAGETTQKTLPILEILRGCYRGRIEIDGWWSPTPFEKDGSGKNMLSIWYDGKNSIIRRGSENIKLYID